MMRTLPGREAGFSLVEIIVAIVLLALGVGAILGLLAQIAGKGSSPIIQTQGLYLAESYLEEALLRPAQDPDGINEGCSAARSLWDDIGDYACLATPAAPTTPVGASIPHLSRYRISVTVGGTMMWGGSPGRRIEVRVQHQDGGLDLRLVGYRADA